MRTCRDVAHRPVAPLVDVNLVGGDAPPGPRVPKSHGAVLAAGHHHVTYGVLVGLEATTCQRSKQHISRRFNAAIGTPAVA